MSYGLYDADLQFYPIPFYNLELMKLSTYYKRKREIVGLAPDFSPHMYTHFIVRQDIYSNQNYPTNYPNIEYGGRAFNGDVYVPLPYEIEIMHPDISLYNPAIPTTVHYNYRCAINTMRKAEHVRLSLDGKNVWKDFEKQLRKDSNCYGLILHDYDAGAIDGGPEFITDVLPSIFNTKNKQRIGMRFPVQIYDEKELIKWLKIQSIGTYYSLHYNKLIQPPLANEILEASNYSTAYKQMSVNINSELQKPNPININIRKVFRNIINLRTQGLAFPLIYDNSVFTDDNWKIVMQLINRYNIHLISKISEKDYLLRIEPFETLYSYVRAIIKHRVIKDPLLSIDSVCNIFQFVRENDYELFKDFYEYRGEEVRK